MLLAATLLSEVAKRINVPYPTLLALAGAVVAFFPGAPHLQLDPEVVLTLFVAPVLMDAAFDMSLRDLRRNWRPVISLVVMAVGLTTLLVAAFARWLMPDLPWAAAITLGALLAPPDAVAALAVMQQVNPPYQIRKVLEGESLLNDATALLIYKLSVGAVAAGGFSVGAAMPTFLLVVVGSAVAGWALNFVMGPVRRLSDDPSAVVLLQFLSTFIIWLAADRIGLSPVVTIVVFAVIASRGVSHQVSRPGHGGAVAAEVTHIRRVGHRHFYFECAGLRSHWPAVGPHPRRASRRAAGQNAFRKPAAVAGGDCGAPGLGGAIHAVRARSPQ